MAPRPQAGSATARHYFVNTMHICGNNNFITVCSNTEHGIIIQINGWCNRETTWNWYQWVSGRRQRWMIRYWRSSSLQYQDRQPSTTDNCVLVVVVGTFWRCRPIIHQNWSFDLQAFRSYSTNRADRQTHTQTDVTECITIHIRRC